MKDVFGCMGGMQADDAGVRAQGFRGNGPFLLRIFTQTTWRGMVRMGAGFPDAEWLLLGSDPEHGPGDGEPGPGPSSPTQGMRVGPKV